jgi:hypothetical protein
MNQADVEAKLAVRKSSGNFDEDNMMIYFRNRKVFSHGINLLSSD